ncbi:hypothetical protein LLH00_06010 [bacterium]|nr:hypothetical protein [bacterium]
MLESLMVFNCIRLRRSEMPNAHGEYSFEMQLPALPCVFVPSAGRVVKDQTGKEVIIDGEFWMHEDVPIEDRLIYQGYEYEIIAYEPLTDFLTGRTAYYRIQAVRRRPYDEEPVTIS